MLHGHERVVGFFGELQHWQFLCKTAAKAACLKSDLFRRSSFYVTSRLVRNPGQAAEGNRT
jgi:hypothetical protein